MDGLSEVLASSTRIKVGSLGEQELGGCRPSFLEAMLALVFLHPAVAEALL